jgi:glycopeptide antibiotics resistance protein
MLLKFKCYFACICTGAFIFSLGLSLILGSSEALFSIGSFDVDDLILNSCGGLVGFLAFQLFAKFMATASGAIDARRRPI